METKHGYFVYINDSFDSFFTHEYDAMDYMEYIEQWSSDKVKVKKGRITYTLIPDAEELGEDE